MDLNIRRTDRVSRIILEIYPMINFDVSFFCISHHFYGSQPFHRLNHRLDDPDMETEAEALNGEATDSRKMEVQIGGAVTLECDGGCWGHGPGMDPVGGPGPLALSRVVYQEAGEYRCVAPDRKMQDTWRAQLPYHIKVTGK